MSYKDYSKKEDDYLGFYFSDAFCITIGEDVPIFERDSPVPKIQNLFQYSVYIHEYWHYLLNISTICRFRDFFLWNHVLSIFSKSLIKTANGKSSGINSLSREDQQTINSLIAMSKVYNGDGYPGCLDKDEEIINFQIEDYDVIESGLSLEGKKIPIKKVILKLKIETENGIKECPYALGNLTIEEGIAYEIDRMVEYDKTNEDSAPPFPYHVLRKLASYITKNRISKFEICVLGTLSLLTTDPAVSLINLIQDYKNLKVKNKIEKENFHILWERMKNGFVITKETILKYEFDGLLNMHKNRGMTEYAINSLKDKYLALLNKREENPFFDVNIFSVYPPNLEELRSFTSEIMPCDTIQEFPGDEDLIERDIIVSFDTRNYESNNTKYSVSEFLRVLHCQQEYLLAHFINEFVPTTTITGSRCPYYTTCGLPDRRNNPYVCKRKPWDVYSPNRKELCWYGNAVASCFGLIELK